MSYHDPWVAIGDFNDLYSDVEKEGGDVFSPSSSYCLSHFINSTVGIDLGFLSNSFTNKNKRNGNKNIRERLDWSIVSIAWRELFPVASIVDLTHG